MESKEHGKQEEERESIQDLKDYLMDKLFSLKDKAISTSLELDYEELSILINAIDAYQNGE